MTGRQTSYGFLHHVARAAVWAVPVLLVATAVAVLIPVIRDLRNNLWRYYSDDQTIRRQALDARPRQTLWSHQEDWSGVVASNQITGGPHFTADDGHAVLAVKASDREDSDLGLTDWNGRSWGVVRLLAGANSASNEFEGVFSPDGNWLYLTSDREGGQGASDIWVARRTASNGWESAGPLTAANTVSDERGLSLSMDGRTLYFASNRGGGAGGYDLFRTRLEVLSGAQAAQGGTSSIPCVAEVERLVRACSEGDDVEPALSPSGDLLYFASNRKDGRGGYDLYVSRVVRDGIGRPENAGEELNGVGDERRPAMRMQGFDMAYAVSVGGTNAARVVSVTRREVVERVDHARLQSYLALLDRIKWWVVALMASLLALIYLIRRYRDLTSLFHKCLMASAIVHAAILFAVATWTVTKEVTESMDAAALEMLVDKVALQDMEQDIGTRKEAMALDHNQQVVALPAAPAPRMATEQDREAVELDEFAAAQPGGTEGGAVVPLAQPRKEQSVVDAVPVSAGQPDAPRAVVAASRELKTIPAELQVASVDEIAMEEQPAGSAAPAGSGGEVKLDTTVAQKTVAGDFVRGAVAETRAVSEAAGGEAVAGPEAMPVKAFGGLAMASVAVAAPRTAMPGEAKAFSKPTGYDVPMQGLETEMEVPAFGEAGGGSTNAPTRAQTWGSGVSGAFDPAGAVAGVAASFRDGGGLGGSGIGAGASGGGGKGTGTSGPVGGAAGVGDVVGGGSGPGGGAGIVAGGKGAAASGSGGDNASVVGGVAPRSGKGTFSNAPADGEPTDAVLTKLAKRGGVRAGDVRLGAPVEMEVLAEYANRGVPDLIVLTGRPSLEVVEALGGSGETEGAIRGSLDWFTRNQEPDGRWSCGKLGGLAGHDTAATALALLCYYGWGMKHNVNCEYVKPVKAGLTWLLGQIQPNGDAGNGIAKGMYDQGIVAMVLCEAYGISRDPALLLPASNTVAFIAGAQNKDGGWRYQPGAADSDLSVFGWQYMALQSARMCGVPFPSNTLAMADKWLDRVSGGKSGGLYGYQGPNQLDRPAMSACGMFCRQLQKVSPTEDRMKETAGFLRTQPLPGNNVDFYYLYYATLALYQHQGEAWEDWNKRMKEVLPPLQRKTGPEAGSWDAQGSRGSSLGRCVSTAMAALSLEVYYRFLPMYGYRSADDEARSGHVKGAKP